MAIRLDKFLADMGIGTRSEVKKMIKKGQVTVNGSKADGPEMKVETTDTVAAAGRVVEYNEYYYYMFYKPEGCVTAREDAEDETVMDVLARAGLKCPAFSQLSPVGRLDKDTTGLLLVTNDGDLLHRLISPSYEADKVYIAQVDGEMDEDDVKAFAAGMEFSDFTARPALLEILSAEGGVSKVRITIHEGKYHQVKRMVAKCGKTVVKLKRVSFGGLDLDKGLVPGNYRSLTKEEVAILNGR